VRLGRIVCAASSSVRETLVNILVRCGLVAPEVLAAALAAYGLWVGQVEAAQAVELVGRDLRLVGF
jgi:hypothetical protein